MRIITFALLLCFISSVASAQEMTTRTIHVFVALCDNDSQGIMPVPALIGDGDDPRNNLYWGALLGLKTYFKKSTDWELVSTEKEKGPIILERLVFRHEATSATLTADAYKGDKIKRAMSDFLAAAAAPRREKADLVAYIGHNGLMEFELPVSPAPADKMKTGTDAIILCCISKGYFEERLKRTRSRAVLLTTGLMAPEAYTLHDALEAWIAGASSETIREKAAQAYHKYQKCGINGARRLFFSAPVLSPISSPVEDRGADLKSILSLK